MSHRPSTPPDLLIEHWNAFYKEGGRLAKYCTVNELRRLQDAAERFALHCERLANAGPGFREREWND